MSLLTDAAQARLLGKRLTEAGYDGVVTLEMYSLEKLKDSGEASENWEASLVFHYSEICLGKCPKL